MGVQANFTLYNQNKNIVFMCFFRSCGLIKRSLCVQNYTLMLFRNVFRTPTLLHFELNDTVM